MTDAVTEFDPCDPVEAYVRPIRSVLFIDDQFPTFADTSDSTFKEADRARALWLECTKRGWLCDIDNSHDWASPGRKQRLSACDLLVLDLHLQGQDSRPALSIIRGLACGDAPNLVVVYTADPKPDQAFLAVAASAHGVSADAFTAELDTEVEEMAVPWSIDDILSFLEDRPRWMGTYTAACKAARLPVDRSSGKVLFGRWISRNFGVSPDERLLTIEKIRCSDNRWFQCGNLFVVLISKTYEQPGDEARSVLAGLESAIADWSPSWLACLVASTRRSVESGSFRDDVNLPPEPLQAGLLRYLRESEDVEERARRAREVASHLLARRFGNATNDMSAQLLRRAEPNPNSSLSGDDDQAQMLHLNAFLCSEVFTRHHLRVGSVFKARDTETYWVCVTPGCDMVPRTPVASVNPWVAELDPMRPLTALRLEVRRGKGITDSLEKAERGRHIFFADPIQPSSQPIVAACFNTSTDDPNPRLEQMFALDRARVNDGKVRLQRCIRDPLSGNVVLESVDCEVVSQLRTPYAERLAHVVGYHLSRIGVNFLQSGAHTPEEQDSIL